MSEILQAAYTMPSLFFGEADVSAREHVSRALNEKFGDALIERLTDGSGAIVGPIHKSESETYDYGGWGESVLFRMWCNVTPLPESPEFRMIGGPADGMIARTGGAREWWVPMQPPMPSVALGDVPPSLTIPIARYERIGDTQGYRFAGVTTR